MKVHRQLKSTAGLCEAQANEPAATSPTIHCRPQFGGVLSFDYLQIYKPHVFFSGWFTAKENQGVNQHLGSLYDWQFGVQKIAGELLLT